MVRPHPLQPPQRQAPGAIVLIMRRLHEDDRAGHVLAQEPWDVVRLPTIADEEEAYRIETVLGKQSFGRVA
jgi:hypothetical protein